MSWQKFLPIVGLLIFLALVFAIGIENIVNAFLSANVFFIALSFIVLPFVALAQVWKWQILLKSQGINVSFFSLLKIYLIGFFYGAITPGKLGSFIRISYLQKKANLTLGKSSSSVFLDRLLDFLSIFLFALFGAFLVASLFSDLLAVISILTIVLLVLIWFFSSKKRSRLFLKKFFLFLVPEKLKKKSSQLFHDFYDSMPKNRDVLKSFFLSLISWFLIFLHSYVIALAFSINASIFFIVGALAIATVVSLIPITFNGIGTNEATLVALFSLIGTSASVVIAFSILSQLLLTYFMALVGFLVLVKYKE